VQLHKNVPIFYSFLRFITVLTRALHWSLSWARSIQSIPHRLTSLQFQKYMIILMDYVLNTCKYAAQNPSFWWMNIPIFITWSSSAVFSKLQDHVKQLLLLLLSVVNIALFLVLCGHVFAVVSLCSANFGFAYCYEPRGSSAFVMTESRNICLLCIKACL
jgi:hypothetical protein